MMDILKLKKIDNKQKNNKIEWITVLRAFACIAVIMLHVIDGWIKAKKGTDMSEIRYFIDKVALQPFLRFAVPCFIMISGCLLLDPKRNVDINKIKKYIIKMLCVLGTFGFLYCIMEALLNNGLSNINIINILSESILNLFQEKSWGHMWYVYMLIGLYIITPIIRSFIEKKDVNEEKFVLILLFILTLVIPIINSVFNINITTFKLEFFKYVLIYMLGYYIVHTDIINSKIIYIGGIIGLIGYLLMAYFLR